MPIALAFLLFYAICTFFVPARWAVSSVEIGIFALTAVWIINNVIRPTINEQRSTRERLPRSTINEQRSTINGKTSSPSFSFVLIPLALTIPWGLTQLFLGTTIYPYETWNRILYWTAALSACFLALQLCAAGEVRERFRLWLLYFAFALCVLSIVQWFTSEGQAFWFFQTPHAKVMGPIVKRNLYASFIQLVLPIALAQAFHDRRNSFLYVVIAGVMFASVIASGSRAGSALVTLEVVAVLILAPMMLRSRKQGGLSLPRLAGQAGLIGAACVLIVGYEYLWQRFRLSDPFAARRELFQSSVEMVKDQPLFGFGMGTWTMAYKAYATIDIGKFMNHAHNEWAQWAAEGGLPLLGLMVAVFLWSIRPAIRSVWGIGVLSVFIHSWVDFPFVFLPLAIWIFVMLGLLAAFDQDWKRARRQPKTAAATPALEPTPTR
jgi:O-antigen ligase